MKLAEFLIFLSFLIVSLFTFVGAIYGLSKFQENHPTVYFYLFVYSAIIYFTFPFLKSQMPLFYEQILIAVFVPIVAHGLFNDQINEAFGIRESLRKSTQST